MLYTSFWLAWGIAVTVLIILHLRDDWHIVGRRQVVAWCCVIGGGVYGLGLFDSTTLPIFNWYYMGTVIVGSSVVLNLLLFTDKGRKIVNYRIRTTKRAKSH